MPTSVCDWLMCISIDSNIPHNFLFISKVDLRLILRPWVVFKYLLNELVFGFVTSFREVD